MPQVEAAAILLKLGGAALAVAGAGLAGLEHARAHRRCAEELDRWITALSALETEISYGHCRLADALARAADVAGGLAGRRLRHAARALWEARGSPGECVRQAMRQLPGSPEGQELAAVFTLSDCLGASHSSDQVRHIRLAMARLERARQAAEERAHRYARLWPSVGFLTGAMVALALL